MTTIEPADIETVLDAYADRRDAPTLNDYFSAAAYPKATKLEREAALIRVRRAWIAALSRHLRPSHARDYVLRQEFHVRATMNEVDALPVTPMPWNRYWPAYRA
jgi:hypothetical protein